MPDERKIRVRMGDTKEEGDKLNGFISLEGVNQDTVEKLRAKLEQYESRKADGNERTLVDTAFKTTVLSVLLENGEVLREALKEQLFKQYGRSPENEILFANAFAVIKNYVEQGGGAVRGGGGF